MSRLALKRVHAYDPHMHSEAQDAQDICQKQTAPVSILVVEDDPPVREFIENALSREGYNVMSAQEGGIALQTLLIHRFDIIITDLVMEPMNGIALLEEALRIWPWLGAIVFSGLMDDEKKLQLERLGVRTLINKPASRAEILEAVNKEATLIQQRFAGEKPISLLQIQNQLSILRENIRTAVEADSLEQALSNLSRDLGQAIPSIATAILTRQNSGENAILVGTLQRCVSDTFIDSLRALIVKRFNLLSGETVREDITLTSSGIAMDNQRGIETPEKTLTFPVINNGVITGLLAMVPAEGYRCSDADISFLYHAANHLTTVLVAFHRIRELAVRDELTGLYNRHHLQDEITSIWQMAVRYGFSIGVLIIDIDHFKSINDNYGHLVGDHVLSEMASIVQSTCRGSDLIARYGGDEIVIILRDTDLNSLGKLARRLVEAVRKHVFFAGKHDVHCTVSIGAAGYKAIDGNLPSSDVLFARADEALYAAKHNGRDRSHIWNAQEKNENPTNKTGEDSDGESPEASMPVPSVLVVDDDRSVLKVTEVLLEMEGYQSKLFEHGQEAFEAIAADPGTFNVALIDLNLNDMNGLKLIEQINSVDHAMVKIVITGEATLDNAVKSLRHGAYDFIQKPIQREVLRLTLHRALEYHRLRVENEEYQHNLEEMVRRKSAELTKALERTQTSFDFTLRAMAAMLDAREHNTGAHSQRVQEITSLIASDFRVDPQTLADIRQGALLHDIGKIAVPDDILLKEGPLNDEEWATMRKHVETGYQLLSQSEDLKGAAELMLCHHEAYDGSGYPRGIKGDTIPLGARIFSLVDAYDAMRSNRPYRQGFDRETALKEVRDHSGTQFDPQVVDVFCKRIDEIENMGNWDAITETQE